MNLGTDPIPRLVRQLAVPASIGFLFNTLFNVVDTWWAGRISTEAQAALSLSFPVFFILIATGSGVAQGATALSSHALGAGNATRARHLAAQAILFGSLLGVALTGLGWAIAPTLFRLLGATDEYLRLCIAYMSVILGGAVFFLLQSIVNAGIQAQGDTKTYRNVLVAGCLLNAGLDPWFLYGGAGLPALGLRGIALSTVLITAGGVVYLVRVLRRSPLGQGLSASDFHPNGATLREILHQGLPASLNMMTVALGIFVITWFLSRFSPHAVAAYGIATRIEQILLLPTIGLNIATLTLTGHNFGAQKPRRIAETWRTSVRYGLWLMAAGGGILLFGAPWLMRAFSADPQVLGPGAAYLRVAAFTLGAYVILYQTVFMLQGLKRPMFALWIGIGRQVAAPVLVFPLLAFQAGLGLNGIWVGIAVVNWSAALLAWWRGHTVLAGLTAPEQESKR